MEHEPKTYFTENEADDVKGFTVLAVDEEKRRYHIGEKWLKPEGEEDRWIDYWIPESDLLERVESDDCSPKGKLTDDQFEAVCERVGWYTDEESEKAAA